MTGDRLQWAGCDAEPSGIGDYTAFFFGTDLGADTIPGGGAPPTERLDIIPTPLPPVAPREPAAGSPMPGGGGLGPQAVRFVRVLAAVSVSFGVAAVSWAFLGPDVTVTFGFTIVAVAIALALANLVALFVVLAVTDGRPDSRSYMAELIEAERAAGDHRALRPGGTAEHRHTRWGFPGAILEDQSISSEGPTTST